MNHVLKGNKIIHGDIVSPEIEIAEFNSQLHKREYNNILSALNHGHEMLMLYMQYHDNMHLNTVVEFLQKAEKIFQQYHSEVYTSKKEIKNDNT